MGWLVCNRFQEGRRSQDAHSTKRIEDKEILVSGDDAIRLAQHRYFKQLVVVWIAAGFEGA